MKKIENPIEVCVQLSDAGSDALRAVVQSSLHFSPIDSASFGFKVLRQLVGDDFEFHKLYDGSYIAVGDCHYPFPGRNSILSVNSVLSLPADEYELQDGKLYNVSFTLNQSDDSRRDYIIQGVRFLRLLGVAVVEIEDDEDKA